MLKLLLVTAVAFASPAWALDLGGLDPNALVSGTNLTGNELGVVSNTIAGDLKFRPVEGARAKPGPWTLSVGLLGGAMSASNLRQTFPNNDVPPVVPEGDIVIVLQITRDVAAEVGFVPSISMGNNKFSKFGGGLKWSASRTFFGEHPGVELAFRGMLTKPSLNLVTGTAELAYSGTIMGATATLGFPVGALEPYLGFGFSTASGNLTGSGSADFFGTPISLSQAIDISSSSAEFFGGFALQAGPVGLGLEAEACYGTVSGIFKLSFQIGPFGDSEPRHDQRVAKRRQQQPANRGLASQPAQQQQPPQQRQAQPAPSTQTRQQPRQQRPDELPPPPAGQ